MKIHLPIIKLNVIIKKSSYRKSNSQLNRFYLHFILKKIVNHKKFILLLYKLYLYNLVNDHI